MSLWVACRQRLLGRFSTLFILLNSGKNEQGKRCRGYRAFRSDADASFGGCGTRFAQTFLAFFPPRHSSQQREERTKKRRRGYRAIRSDADASFGGCGTRSAQTVLAFFPPRLPSLLPDKSGMLRNMVFCSFFSTAGRTNGEVPLRLSGFSLGLWRLVRGLRNSLCSNIPRLFPSSAVALAAR